MFQAHNKISVSDAGHAAMLEDRFRDAGERMRAVPGFVKFALLRARDGTHYIVSTLWETEQAFEQWRSSPHFQAAHAGRTNARPQAELGTYDVIF